MSERSNSRAQRTAVLLLAVLVVALPFLFRQDRPSGAWRPGDPVLVVISPHSAAIREEFGEGFSAWHALHHGSPVRIDWRSIGGTTEIMRYLVAEYGTAFRAHWRREGREWPDGGAAAVLDRRFRPDRPPPTHDDPREREAWNHRREAWLAFRNTDDPDAFGSRIDVFFGGGTYDHGIASAQGILVPAWPEDAVPPHLLREQEHCLFPESRGGEIWRTPTFYSAALSAFGICYNPNRLRDLGIEQPPRQWRDLADPRYRGQIGVADPTKSGSIAKAFETIVHTECHRAVADAGFSLAQVAEFEAAIAAAGLPDGELPPGVPEAYQAAVEHGWLAGIHLLQRIGANSRYFTDGAGKVAVDVSNGDAAAGIAIDFFGRVQAEITRGPDGRERLHYVTPYGGSSVSGDPIGILRGARNRELAERFLEYVLGPDGQRLWNYRPGTPGGPRRHALRRLPVRRDFYASDDPELHRVALEHARHTSDDLLDPAVDAYRLSGAFDYVPRWTARHFGFFRLLVRSMCLDAGVELRDAWSVIIAAGGPEAQPEAMARLRRLPERPVPISWSTAAGAAAHDRLETSREWTLFFRRSYREAAALARARPQAQRATRGPDP